MLKKQSFSKPLHKQIIRNQKDIIIFFEFKLKMSNMFNVLYNRYIDQIKLQQIQNYNQKHRDYLIREGKLSSSNSEQNITKKNERKNYKGEQRENKPSKNWNAGENQVMAPSKKQSRKEPPQQQNHYMNQQHNLKSDQRPIKQNQNAFNKIPPNSQSTVIIKQSSSSYSYEVDEQSNTYFKQQPIKKQPQERSIKPPQPAQNNQQFSQFPDEQEEVILEQCPEGCGRKFKSSVLQKHIKICQKVFQGKRKQFKVDIVDDEAKNLAVKSTKNTVSKPKTQKVPKWKKQSQMLRKGLKSNQQGQGSQPVPVQDQDDRKQCPGCGRKFNQDAAQRHIPNCVKRIKQRK